DVAWLGRGFTLVVLPKHGAIGLVSVPGDPDSKPEPEPEPEKPAAPPRADSPPATWTREDISTRLAAWRERVTSKAPASASEASITPLPERITRIEGNADVHPGGWRGELAAWARAACALSYREIPRLDCGVLDDIAARLELGEPQREA